MSRHKPTRKTPSVPARTPAASTPKPRPSQPAGWRRKIKSLDWYRTIPIVISCVALVFSFYNYADTKSERKITNSIQRANYIFENAGIKDTIQLLKAFHIYKENPSDISCLVGHKNFLELAITRRDELQMKCDFWIKWYLLRAKELYDSKKVQDLLKECEE